MATMQSGDRLGASAVAQQGAAGALSTTPTTTHTTAVAPAQTEARQGTSVPAAAPSEAASRLTEAVDGFIQDVERKFQSISDEILGRLDEMAERCDRLEQDMLARESGSGKGGKSVESLEAGSV